MGRKVRNLLTLTGSLLLVGGITLQAGLLTSCENTTIEGVLVVDSLPLKVNYNLNEKLDLTGLVVYGKKIEGEFLSNTESVLIENFETSLKDGETLDKEGEFDVVISAKGYQETSFKITVGDVTVKKLVVRVRPRKVSYKVGEQFNTNGLSVAIQEFKNGKEEGAPVSLKADEYKTSIVNGQVLDKEGSFLVEVYKDGYESVYFQIAVLTENNDLVNVLTTLSSTRSYQIEIYNTVATTVDQNGFHYKEVVNENYYNKITYNKSQAEEPEDQRGLNEASNVAYVNYTGGVYQVDLKNTLDDGTPAPGKVLSGETKWYDADLVDTFEGFDLKSAPTTTKNGKFVIEIILDEKEKAANSGQENQDWTKSLAANPFATKFLGLCGWSDSLIEILTTIDIETDGFSYLNLRGNLGGYGYTTLNVSDIGFASVEELDQYVARTDRHYDTSIDDCVKEPKLLELFQNKLSNYTLEFNGQDNQGNRFVSCYTYLNDNVVWFQPTNEIRRLYASDGITLNASGFICVSEPNATLASIIPSSGDGSGIYEIHTDVTSNGQSFSDSFTLDRNHISLVLDNGQKADPSTFKTRTYKGYGELSDLDTTFIFEELGCLIDSSLEKNYANSWFLETRLSSESNPFIISYNPEVLELLCETMLGKGSYKQYKSDFNSAIISPTYEINENTHEVDRVTALEFWCLNLNTLRGYVNSLTEINSSTIPDYVSQTLVAGEINL